VNGKTIDRTKRTETAAVIAHLSPSKTYDIRVFSVSAGRFQTPSAPLHVRLPGSSQPPSEDGSSESLPIVRPIAARAPSLLSAPSAPAMTREHSGGPVNGRRGTTGRRSSPAGASPGELRGEDENEDLAELSARFAAVREEIEAVEKQVQEENAEHESQIKELESKKEKIRADLKKRDEESSDLRKQVHKAESQNRALLNDRSKKEKELKARENERRKKKDDIAKWEEQISTMAEEINGIETQKAAIRRRNEANVREVEAKVEEERKEVAALEEEVKEKTQQLKALEEERQQLDVEDETDETREADRLEQERELKWRNRFHELVTSHARLYHEFQQATVYMNTSRDRLQYYEALRQNRTVSFAQPPPPLNIELQRQRSLRRPRHTNSHGSSVSSPRGPYIAEPFQPNSQFGNVQASSPTTFGPSYFNPQNGMTLVMPNENATTPGDDNEGLSSIPMSPHADALLPADLLGDDSAEEDAGSDAPMPTRPTVPDGGKSHSTPFPNIGSPLLRDDVEPAALSSAGSSSGQSFASPRGDGSGQAPDSERKAIQSGKQPEKPGEDESPSSSRKFMQNLFNRNRQRGKTLADEAPTLGSLKPTQSQSFPRNFDEFDPSAQPRRRLSYGGNWAFPGGILNRDKDSEPSRFAAASRRAFPSIMGFGKSADGPNFTPRTNSFDPAIRGDTNSPRPSSIYSFDKMPKPSLADSMHAWAMDRNAMRNSPLAPDWGSMHSFSRSHSRRPSIGYGSTTNLSMMGPDDEIVEPKREQRPLQAPIGTRPVSSQKKEMATPRLNPAAPNFTSLFKKSKGEKVKIRDPKEKETDQQTETEGGSPPDSRKSKDAPSIAPTISTMESKESLDRTTSAASVAPSGESRSDKLTLMSRISRTASTKTYFGSWKEKSFLGSKSSKDTMPEGSVAGEDDAGSMDQLGRSTESRDSLVLDGVPDSANASGKATPKEKEKGAGRSSINWNFMRKSKEKGSKEKKGEAAPSEVSVSEASVAGSEVPTDAEDNDDDRRV
jgi:hypothetical protein